jgi:hypothetical protein
MDTFPALLYGTLIIGVIFIGSAFFVADFNTNYPNTNMNYALDNSSVQEVNNSINTLNKTISEATDSATQYTSSDNPLTAAFGYLLGVFTAIKGMIITGTTIPHLIGGIAMALTTNLSIFYPSWFGVFITLALAIMGLIYAIYVLSKVK